MGMLQKWNSPFSLIESMEDTNWPLQLSNAWAQFNKEMSVYEDDNTVTIEAALPGLSEEDVEITFDKGTLLIRGEKKVQEEDKKRKYFRRMNTSRIYQLSVPNSVDEMQEPKAEITNGVAKITFQKQKKSEPRRIPVKKGK